ncbi:MAG: hypothetical protein QG577_734 [Thermodesulfobacteriota bacterium]|nr:hypothetical protein [Thermodesulfobacteriota bacterium]
MLTFLRFRLCSLLQDIRTLREGVMLRKSAIELFMLFIFAIAIGTMAYAESASPQNDTAVGTGIDYTTAYKGIAKVKPPAPSTTGTSTATKVKPFTGVISGLDAISSYNPVTWGPECIVPIPAKGQFLVGPKIFFPRVRGDARKDTPGATPPQGGVDFEHHLGFKRSGTAVWSIEALYQFRPSWGIRYSFSPMTFETSGEASTGFTYGGQTFSAGALVRSKWERFQHRAGILYNLSYTTNSLTSFYADWLHIDDKLVVSGEGGTRATANIPVIWTDSKNLAVAGLEFSKGLRNYRGNSLTLDCKAGIAFLDDTIGYEAEAGLTYMIPIKTGRFGFVKGGYQFMSLKSETNRETFNTSMDGAFVKFGFLF